MPSKGINFSQAKARTASLSTNPRTSATRKWEQELGGLSLALHRVNKAATVARGRAIAKVKKEPSWIHANQEIRDRMIKDAVDEVNRNREIKKEQAKVEWRALHEEEEEDKEVEDESMDDSDGASDEADNERAGDQDSESSSGEEGEEEYSEGDSEDTNGGESEAEEVDDEDDEESQDLTEEQRKALNNRLLTLRAKQGEEYEGFIGRVEAQAKSQRGKETPDDYEFGG